MYTEVHVDSQLSILATCAATAGGTALTVCRWGIILRRRPLARISPKAAEGTGNV